MSAAARRVLPFLRVAWPWLLLGTIAALGWGELKQIDLVEVRRLLRGTDSSLVLALLALTAANLAVAGRSPGCSRSPSSAWTAPRRTRAPATARRLPPSSTSDYRVATHFGGDFHALAARIAQFLR